jgi:hypothetical protein
VTPAGNKLVSGQQSGLAEISCHSFEFDLASAEVDQRADRQPGRGKFVEQLRFVR